jgi:hypothetical protein
VRKTGILIIAIVALGLVLGFLLYRPNEVGLDEWQESAPGAQLRTIDTEEVAYFINDWR